MKNITRKEFIKRSGLGAAAISLMPGIITGRSPAASGFRALGNTGIMVSPVCYGASRTKDEGLIRYALDKGINFLDTGRSYANGNNERLVGRVIEGIRDKVVVQSKHHLEEKWLRSKGKGRKGHTEIKDILTRGLEESLEALGTDYIDIYHYHSADIEWLTYHDAVLKFFSDQKSAGTIRASGFSSHDYTLGLLLRNNRERIYDVIMHPFNFNGGFTHSLSGWSAKWNQDKLVEQLKIAGEGGTGIVAMKTCSAGPMEKLSNGSGYREAVHWVLDHEFISSAAVAMPNIEQIDDITS